LRIAAIGVSDGHHNISHHQGNKDNLDKIAKIDRFYMEQLAYFLDKLKTTEDVDGKSLLHNSMIVYGGCLSDGDRHNHDDLPVLLLGKGGGTIEAGRHLVYSKDTPLMNLYLSLFERLGCPTERFGDSTGKLKL